MFVLVRRGFCPRVLSAFCLEGFVPCVFWFLSVPLLSDYMYIRYNRKLNITFSFNLRFHVYKKFKSVTSHVLGPRPSVTNCQTFSDPLPPSSVTYFMDGPQSTPSVDKRIETPCCFR